MSEIKVDLDKYQDEHDRYVIIKDFYKIGSAVMGFDKESDLEFRTVLSKCLLLHEAPLQVVRVGGPHCLDMYGEYGPYTVYDDYKDLIQICVSGNCPGEVNPLIPDSPYKEEQRKVVQKWKKELNLA
jgi:hypothetical protein